MAIKEGYLVEGLYNQNKPHVCRWIQNDGTAFEGEFRNSKLNGHGTMRSINGDKYVGEYRNGLKHGKGVQTYSRGDTYDGEWQDDYFHGKGKLSSATGDVKFGIFNKG